MFVSKLMLQSRSNETNAKHRTILAKDIVFWESKRVNYIQRSNNLVLPFPSRLLLLHLEDVAYLWSLIQYMQRILNFFNPRLSHKSKDVL